MVRVILTAVILTLFGVTVLAAPVNEDEDAKLEVSESNDYDFDWSSELSDGGKIRQLAYKKQLDDGTEILVVAGYYSYVGPNGTKFTVIYYADENGYHPRVIFGDQPIRPNTLMPLSGGTPPIPESLFRSLVG